MDLAYVLNKDSQRLKQADSLGYDLDAMLIQCEGMFKTSEELGLTNQEMAQAFFRLRDVQDMGLGRPLEPDLVLFENSPNTPTRLAVEDKRAQHTYCFTLTGTQDALCEECRQTVPRSAVKGHVAQRHH